ncbi:hypothetical protein CRENBAI_003287 [Crenichthys baileyi]|uniref:C2H2-type domain-containing protein n=1 Tax=Crenichthys baileyi TaxID=28760 RepID=A0AAV9S2J8_9TELE
MKEIDYIHQNSSESLLFEDKVQMKQLGALQDVGRNRTTDDEQLLMIKEERPFEWSSSEDEQDPEHFHMKEEHEELWINQDGEQIYGEEDLTSFPLNVIVKSEDEEEEEYRSSHLYHRQTEHNSETEPLSCSSVQFIKTEPEDENCSGPESTRKPGLNNYLQIKTAGKASDSSETEVSDNDDHWQEPLPDCGGEIRRKGLNEGRAADLGDTAKALYSCFECDKQYFYKQSLHRHMKCHSSSSGKTNRCVGQENSDSDPAVAKKEKVFICDVCGHGFNQRTNLTTHKRVHTGEKPFRCEDCGKRFNQRGNLRNHKRIHTGERPFICDFCGERFRNQGILQAHMRVHTGEKPFVCAVCGRKFSRKTHFETHMRVHTGERPFSCGICGKDFRHKLHYQEHIRVHTGELPFPCEVCGKKFRLQCNLKRHLRVHTGEKPFGCDECGKTFSCKSHLKRHTKVHTGVRPFSCEICGDTFAEPGAVKSHILVHTGEKPFECDVCGKTFRQKSTLTRHKVVHTGEKPFCCALCGARFTQQCNLKTHMRLHTR